MNYDGRLIFDSRVIDGCAPYGDDGVSMGGGGRWVIDADVSRQSGEVGVGDEVVR